MSVLIETQRCILREILPSDAPFIYKLNLHPEIFKFTTDPPFESIREAEIFINKYDAYIRTGIGRWAIQHKAGNSFLGWCGLKYIHEENEVDIGYRLLPEYWGNGFAVETAVACCEYGMQELGLTRIVARIHKENFKSIRVAEKMKMIYEKDLDYDGVPWMNYIYSPIRKEKQSSKRMIPPGKNSCFIFP